MRDLLEMQICIWRKQNFWSKSHKQTKKKTETLTSYTCGIELKMCKTILCMVNLVRDQWNRKSTVPVLKISEKSIRKLTEYCGVVDLTLIHSFFCSVRECCCSAVNRLSKSHLSMLCTVYLDGLAKKTPSVLAQLGWLLIFSLMFAASSQAGKKPQGAFPRQGKSL